ncbi:glycosyltransferase family 2 protein [Merismopedia glauca]|uniref:Glycosyltransferase family 2 protein n=1 Tax=Merismopedia glauca CCAP 1448/3 TaxID=1296344 RepID=A0A2T1C3N6_9CYAN|nr:glycosyltransferase family A protein [Merismopedia glauca]PSB02890.1 glycosyltransferase family 2 protein [Merismopedia glauca CCAP 1448/3]
MNKTDLVSVIIPVYNGDRYLKAAIESVLSQTYKSIEIIVVDDGSTDSSAEVAQSFTSLVRYYFQPNSGSGAARNYGIELALGEFIAFLDADDLWLEDKLAIQIAAFNSNPDFDIVMGQVKQFHSPELDETTKAKIYCPPELMPGNIPSAVLIKREAFTRVGQFHTNWEIGEFIDWYVRATELNLKTMMLPDLVTLRRLHTANKGVQQRQNVSQYVHIIKASLDRRRAAKQKLDN